MRIAIFNWTRRQAGGVEFYLGNLISGLAGNNDLLYCFEIDEPANRSLLPLPDQTTQLSLTELGLERLLKSLRDWQPDLLLVHGLLNTELEQAILSVAPAIIFAHSYYGSCISGTKSWKNPVIIPCQRSFDWRCLLHFYPHHCGGLNPLMMWREYQRQSQRQSLLANYRAVLTFSQHMCEEYLKQGLSKQQVYSLRYFISPANYHGQPKISPPWQLLFLGRMDQLKGGRMLLSALPTVAAALPKPLNLTFIGDGPDRDSWQAQAAKLTAANSDLKIDFVGWQQGEALTKRLAEASLLVVPSLWPEPFGLVGPEAGRYGLPAAAFKVGGIPDWLNDGVNGYLAPADPPTAAGLAQAIIRCLQDPAHYLELRQGAKQVAAKFINQSEHLAELENIFQQVVSNDH